MKKIIFTLLVLCTSLHTFAQNQVVVTGGVNDGKTIDIANLNSDDLVGATKIVLTGSAWTQADITSFINSNRACASTLREFSMSGVMFANGTIALDNLFNGFTELSTITLPAVQQWSAELSLNSSFKSLGKLTQITNLNMLMRVSDMTSAFEGCSMLVRLDLNTGFSYNNISYNRAFANCESLEEIVGFEGLRISNSDNMFNGCESLKSVTFTKMPEDLSSTIFDGLNPDCLVVLPETADRAPAQWLESHDNFVVLGEQKLLEDVALDGKHNYKSLIMGAGVDVVRNGSKVRSIENLTVKSSKTAYFSIDGAEKVKVNELLYKKDIDEKNFYIFSVPFDIPLNSVIAANTALGNYGQKWGIIRYDEAKRAQGGEYEADGETAADNWAGLNPGDMLRANVAYAASVAGKNNEQTIEFPFSFGDNGAVLSGSDEVAVTATQNGAAGTTSCGWNLVSIPSLAKGYYTITFNGKGVNVNVPINEGKGGYTQGSSQSIMLSPTQGFFVQVPSSGVLKFQKQSAKSAIAARVDNVQSEGYNMLISSVDSAEYKDNAALIFNNEAPRDEYYILYDLQKMSTFDDKARIYIQDHNTKLAFSAINPEDYSEVNVGVYAPKAGEYLLELPEVENGMGVVLYDKQLDMEVTSSTYSFDVAEQGHVNDRFVLRISRMTTDNDMSNVNDKANVFAAADGVVVVEGAKEGASVEVYAIDGSSVVSENITSSRHTISGLDKGMYVVMIAGEATKVIL